MEWHWEMLKKVLRRCRAYGLKMNLKKCVFGVSSGLAVATEAFAPLFRKGKKFVWIKEYGEAYQRVQQLVTNLPTMKAPVLGILLKLYLAIISNVVGALLAQDNPAWEESPIYYVSRQLRGAKTHYEKTERLCLALFYGSQWLRTIS
ncbi:uncharacterized protein [Malus domestica]|uniref:uncharacterized protein n=1 Tax=Malus domestica TaxID=3750 RepID=UPI0039766960